ncbi:energy transducer TonB [Stenotrophomonas pictorum JCM 9942]|uniref:Energy transducer TonB n=1 Tax=Stenotrophomonas pictorum JCM 9942 TaxID=1236960 RepID=A0A0R0AIG8_9GAMM|nr:energy transducer TonB [Stenotrophomonas pictorum]KRG44725.1 energy transducer TonB [Stenotrophomonas pictorum JCM 9942]
MKLRLLLGSLTTVAVLGACNSPQPPASAAVAPTEVAALQTPPPDYPAELACTGVGGKSVLNVLVGAQGTPTDVTLVTSSGNSQLDDSAITRVREWKFKPATRNGQPVPTTIQVPVSFNPPQPKPDECFAIEERMRRGG